MQSYLNMLILYFHALVVTLFPFQMKWSGHIYKYVTVIFLSFCFVLRVVKSWQTLHKEVI